MLYNVKKNLVDVFLATALALVPVILMGLWELNNQPLVLENGQIDDSAERSLIVF